MSLVKDIKAAVTVKPIHPALLPTSVTHNPEDKDLFLKGFDTGWQDYKLKIKPELLHAPTYGAILPLANIDPPYHNTNNPMHDVGYGLGWMAYRRFLKKTIFG